VVSPGWIAVPVFLLLVPIFLAFGDRLARLSGLRPGPLVERLSLSFVISVGAVTLVVFGLAVVQALSRWTGLAVAAVRAAKYPPEGIRGIAGSTRAGHYGYKSGEYFETANRDIFVFVQIETPEGVKNIDEILSVKGVDGIFIGPMDLATTHGFRGKPGEPKMLEIIRNLEVRIKAAGKALATVCSDFEDAKAKYDRGYSMITLSHDTVHLGKVARDELGKFRKQVLGE